jgi:hypothetical protein
MQNKFNISIFTGKSISRIARGEIYRPVYKLEIINNEKITGVLTYFFTRIREF